ncbi:glutamine--fructose-6-phosphate aminotransferase [Candidatus Nomurabacteria bacterium RIFOXYC2_FULL_36_19]|uniref:Glutamine--fructose-6-phosphate aminotransferase [isomerizing] n=2 Tax=Candidatus Nomuraibacteriota TaxID=1752729 RepID=A0A1F6YWI7_9BACT|nr:MAG: Isomerizing Glutamine-fructose-6-phosphate aminotransferase [Candidatus Nomurabacteria bacterium GW2011_GWC2_35_8]OGJ06156.1 MAG: glutamine--fructose-6-phosphate aminotransferase [Candidatus Nomurabacteria bacterium RIFOXYA2_FULL_35_9]OGJ10717.1 MAG: glutamine--fructose-6-phosphate aminotransferase [Candidatus Nomurabacteria bacterium RIFOXYC2_FULL_36_19]OGJ13910.1 MAG: glutamine--fructose-6-phosphate aminotransferase [Candidatus Nomurabacteria bacterium RIFOXYD2_FULL_35_12]
MCGIVGYIGKKEAWPILIKGLERLEYRGYDSAGIALMNDRAFFVCKKKGKVVELSKFIKNLNKEEIKKNLSGKIGIAHTRWATHGIPSDSNAHPHLSNDGTIAIVHNGIIENYLSIKKILINKGYKFKSDTDTEVLANLIEDVKKHAKVSIDEAVRLALNEVNGAYAILVISKEEPDTMVIAKLGSPVVIGVGKNEFFIASDATPIIEHTKKVIYLEDGEMAVINNKNKKFNLKIKTITDKTVKIPYIHQLKIKIEELEKGGFPHFMLKEIFEQPESLRNTMRGRIVLEKGNVKFGGLEKFKKELENLNHLTIVGMGTARFAGLIGEYAIEELSGIRTKVEYGSEFTYRDVATPYRAGLIAISQSGETADTLNAIKKAKRDKMLTLGVVNVIGSTIAREVDAGIYNHIGPETAVASTKASTSQVLLLIMLAIYLGRMRGNLSKNKSQEILKEIEKLPALVEIILKNSKHIKQLAKKYKKSENFFFLGRKYNTGAAMEGALKLKECSYIHAEGCNSAELKHGPISLIDKDFPSLVIAPIDSMYEKNKSHIQEIKARGGIVIALTTEGNKELNNIADDVIYIPKTLEILTPILAFVPMQLLAYYISVERGNDVDKPRNLAKSVTVE